MPVWVRYLLAFDVKYRERRLHFLIEGQNRLYEHIDQARFNGLDPLVVDRLKREFYARLDALRRKERADYYSADVYGLVHDIIPEEPTPDEVRNLHAYAAAFVDQHFDKLDRLIEALAAEIKLDDSTRDLDDLLASLDPAQWHPGRAARGAGQLSRLPVLGRADLPDDQRARDRRAQRDPGRPHQPAGHAHAERASRASPA